MTKLGEDPRADRATRNTDGRTDGAAIDGSVDLADCIHRIAEDRDETAFAQLYAHFGSRLKAYMISTGTNSATAEEVAQEALVRVWNKAGSFQVDKGNPTTWIFSIARNVRIDRIRKERVWLFSQKLPESYDEQPSPEPSPDHMASERERAAAVRAAISALPSDQKEVIVMSFLNGLSHSEIAARLDLPLGTIKSRIRIAYGKLRPVLAEHG